jgi:hypothetical protein
MTDEENKNVQVFMDYIADNLDGRFQCSYHGPNCRYCNRHPLFLRKIRWRIEDFINLLRYGREPKELYRLDQYFERENGEKKEEKN